MNWPHNVDYYLFINPTNVRTLEFLNLEICHKRIIIINNLEKSILSCLFNWMGEWKYVVCWMLNEDNNPTKIWIKDVKDEKDETETKFYNNNNI